MTARLLILAGCCLATFGYTTHAMRPEPVALREPLSALPVSLDQWTGKETAPFRDDVVASLGVDDYTNRVYVSAAAAPVGLYVGFYRSQRQGDTIHSPLNCLPGAGWQIAERQHADLDVSAGGVAPRVNLFVIQKGLDRQVVLYWYQSHGRVNASEYWSRADLIWQAMRYNRSDAAMVRVITPIGADDAGGTAAARRALRFANALFPHLERSLPS
jgi:EpsI family protein